jgi:hypothetical protein
MMMIGKFVLSTLEISSHLTQFSLSSIATLFPSRHEKSQHSYNEVPWNVSCQAVPSPT